MPCRDIAVIGTSAGGIEAMRNLFGRLPAELKMSLFVVYHIGPSSPGILAEILDRNSPLPVSTARNQETFVPGRIYVAPPDQHLLIQPNGQILLGCGPKENCFRPAIDPLFRSAALAFGPRVVGIILTGFLDDGTAGLQAVKDRGGITIVQHPEDAAVPSMPLSAIKNVEVNYCVPLDQIAPLLIKLSHSQIEKRQIIPASKELELEVQIAGESKLPRPGFEQWGELSQLSCPECHGVLRELRHGSQLRFRCHTGHAYSLESLLAELDARSEEAIWNAIRTIKEKAMLLREAAELLSKSQHDRANHLRAEADEAQTQSELLRTFLKPHNRPADNPADSFYQQTISLPK